MEINRVQQRHELCDDNDLHRAFTQYWTQFWHRDDTEDARAWDEWCHHIKDFQMYQLISSKDMTNIGYWKIARAEMKTHSSQGVCGWSVPDLKILSDSIVKDRVSILTSQDDGWPAWMMTSRVTMLAKRENCVEEDHTRPIIVTSLAMEMVGVNPGQTGTRKMGKYAPAIRARRSAQ